MVQELGVLQVHPEQGMVEWWSGSLPVGGWDHTWIHPQPKHVWQGRGTVSSLILVGEPRWWKVGVGGSRRGSGGSIWLETHIFDGDGVVDVSGGDGYMGQGSAAGGGGAGDEQQCTTHTTTTQYGSVRVYYTYNHYIGQFLATGGDGYEPGGPGTVYLHRLQPDNQTQLLDATSEEAQVTHDSNVTQPLTNRTLYINNLGKRPRDPERNLSSLYTSYASTSTVAWILPAEPSQIADRNIPTHYFPEDVIIDELHLYVQGNISRSDWDLCMGTAVGKFTSAFNQTLYAANAHLPMDLTIYPGGLTTTHGELRAAGVTVDVQGVVANCENITVVDGGIIKMHEMIDLHGHPTETFNFNAIEIRNHGTLQTSNGQNRRVMKGTFVQAPSMWMGVGIQLELVQVQALHITTVEQVGAMVGAVEQRLPPSRQALPTAPSSSRRSSAVAEGTVEGPVNMEEEAVEEVFSSLQGNWKGLGRFR
ncbi:hypothetical protein Bbelb_427220 [Branchiostoma belcheri]|nr:hypothetical protein Bbelb_427220 [Branchiostoma belcheri]